MKNPIIKDAKSAMILGVGTGIGLKVAEILWNEGKYRLNQLSTYIKDKTQESKTRKAA